jgi:hypothetical protein
MNRKATWLTLPLLVAGFVAGWAVRGHNDVAAQQTTSHVVTDMYSGPDGLTHLRDLTVKLPQLEKAHAVQISRIAPNSDPKSGGYVNWHNAPHRRYVVVLKGRFEVEVENGGKTKSFGPGDVLLAEDITGKGHLTRAVGEDCVWMFVELDEPRARPAEGAQR